jgi:hypothetical protein
MLSTNGWLARHPLLPTNYRRIDGLCAHAHSAQQDQVRNCGGQMDEQKGIYCSGRLWVVAESRPATVSQMINFKCGCRAGLQVFNTPD